LTKPGEIGELCVRGPGVIAGYYRQPELTKKAFDKDEFFCTGDLFQIVDERAIAFFDRKKDIIKRGGFTISSAEVEKVLKKRTKIMDAAVVGYPDERLGERGFALSSYQGQGVRDARRDKGVHEGVGSGHL